ncbi:fasciclin domain-containing protein [Terriglobus roseus]|uniref:Uncaracterized surface protein containing fasciclin (FAS1) repeats n=1 Tax=Terriglobus roseus TaxID=392734 RepID=A0A1G7LE64_9BACT|nr:fasciclin domain-containing protein [Terriglobus roseus]SDF47691.1 Uncaracterized surface protein containing fasciclin (FAS1) repeats [Terriglobus roseus]
MKTFKGVAVVLVCMSCSVYAARQKSTEVGGVQMPAKNSIAENSAASPVLTTFATDMKSTGLEEKLNDKGPYTVFAPTDDAFKKLPAGTADGLRKPENSADLTKVLSYLVVPGKITSAKLKKMVKKGHGTATLTSIEGETITVKNADDVITLTDDKGNSAVILTADVPQKNGLIHIVDGVLLPN